MKLSALVLCVPLLALGHAAQATPSVEEVTKVLTKNACLACHSIDKKVIGPAYTDVAAMYKGNPDAAAILTKAIKTGSTGVFGPIPMPPNIGVSDADIKTVVDWLVAGAPH